MYEVFYKVPSPKQVNTLNGNSLNENYTNEYGITMPMWQALYSNLVEDKLIANLFYDGEINSFFDFYSFLNSDSNWVYAIYEASNNTQQNASPAPLAFCWLNGFSGKTALIHFAVFKAGLSQAEAIGRFTTKFLLFSPEPISQEASCADYDFCMGNKQLSPKNERHDNNEATNYCPDGLYCPDDLYCLDAIYGLTPQPFRHAINFIKNIGFKELALLPATASIKRPIKNSLEYKTRVTNSVLTILTREQILEQEQAENLN